MKRIISGILIIFLLVSGIPCFAQEVDTKAILPIPYEPTTTLFSFASDSNHNGPTFKGYAGTTTIAGGAEVDFMIDTNNDTYGGLITILSNFNLKGEGYDYNVFNIGSQYLHVWKFYSEMTFSQANGGSVKDILGIGFKEGVLTSWSPSPDTLGETMTLQCNQSADQSIYMNAYALLNGIGIPSYYLSSSKDVAFTFTNVRSLEPNGNINNLVNLSKGIFKDNWKAEGSFSASAAAEKMIIMD